MPSFSDEATISKCNFFSIIKIINLLNMLSFINRHLYHFINTVTDCLLDCVGVAMEMSVKMAPALPLIVLILIHSE